QRDGHIVLPADVQDLVEILVEGVFLAGHAHPGKDQGAAPGDDVHLPFLGPDLVDGPAGDAAVEGHKIHAVLSVEADLLDEIPGGQGGQVSLVVEHAVVDGHGADHGRALGGQFAAAGLGVPV